MRKLAHCFHGLGAVVISEAVGAEHAKPAWWNGRHRRLKISRQKCRAGSSPAAGTKSFSFQIPIVFNEAALFFSPYWKQVGFVDLLGKTDLSLWLRGYYGRDFITQRRA